MLVHYQGKRRIPHREFVEREGAVFSQESIDAALQDFEPMDL